VATVRPGRERLSGLVEVDDAYLGGVPSEHWSGVSRPVLGMSTADRATIRETASLLDRQSSPQLAEMSL